MRVVDLFCGCGGLSLGFQNAGFDVIVAIDNWKPSLAVYRDNFDHLVCEKDLSISDGTSFLRQFECDIIIGGPPCQDYSSAGKRDETLGRATLTNRFVDIVLGLKPRFFVMENVSQAINSNTVTNAVNSFLNSGYGLTQRILDASYYGAPQLRKRYFLIGELNGRHNALGDLLDAGRSRNRMTVYDYLGDTLHANHYYRHPRSYQRRGIFSIHEPSPTIRGVNRPIPKDYRRHPNDSADPKDARPLTTIERSYIQTFPSTFVFKGTKTALEQMIGNAVPVKLSEHVATCLMAHIRSL